MSEPDSRMHILQMIEDGKLSAAEGLRLLNAMSGKASDSPTGAEAEAATPGGAAEPEVIEARPAGAGSAPTGEVGYSSKPSAASDPQIQYWKRWWMIPMFVGIGVTIVGALLMYWAVQSTGIGFWFLCSWLPLLLGLGLTAVAWASRTSRWVHIRIDNSQGGHRIAISLPVPLRVVAWGLRMVGGRIEALKNTAVDEMLLALEDSATPDAPIFIDVNKGEKGERVQVYIG